MAKTILLSKVTPNPLIDGTNRDGEFRSHFPFSFTTIEHFFKSLNVYWNHSPIEDLVVKLKGVQAVGVTQFKVFNSIVRGDSVYVVNALSLFKGTTKMLRHNISMFENSSVFVSIGMAMNIQPKIVSRFVSSLKVARFLSFLKLSFDAITNSLYESPQVVSFFFHGNSIALMTEVVND